VVSIGNITVGGTGKTGMTLALVRALTSNGLRCCVLIRGYRGASEHAVGVVADGQSVLMDPAQAGDEACLLARSLPGVPVIAGRDRRATGRVAVEQFRPDVLVLDDGMQYYQLHRDVEITLLDGMHPFGNGLCLPAGILREPASHLRRSDWVIISGAVSHGDADEAMIRRVRRHAGHERIMRGWYEPKRCLALDNGSLCSLASLRGTRVGTLCGIGNPLRFEHQVAALGAVIVYRARLADHAILASHELVRHVQDAVSAGAELVLVTAKDAVKIEPSTHPIPLYVLEADYVVEQMDIIVADIVRRVAARRAVNTDHSHAISRAVTRRRTAA
jgi:tetraacyldisaccharide 4'-kinase